MKLVAVRDCVVLKVLPKETKSIIATVKEEDGDFCEVMSIGPDVKMTLAEGDLVLRPTGMYEYSNEETKEVFLVVGEADICALGVED